MQMINNKILITILIFLILTFSAAAQNSEKVEKSAENDAVKSSSSNYGTSLFLRYNLTRPDYANTPYLIGFDLGTDIDLGGNILFF